MMTRQKTTVYKAGLSTVGHLYNLVTKNVTKYVVLTTYKILKITKKHLQFFEKKLRGLRRNFFCRKPALNKTQNCFIYCSTIFKKLYYF